MNFELFITVLAWVFFVPSLILMGLRMYLSFTYTNSLEEIADSMKGFKKTYPIKIPATITGITLAWIIYSFLS